MNGIGILLGIAVASIAIYLVIKPLIANDAEPEDGLLDREDVVEREKESVFATLAEIEFDYQMGKMTQEDYKQLQEKYKHQAVGILQVEAEDLGTFKKQVSSLEEEVEAELEKELERELVEIKKKVKKAK